MTIILLTAMAAQVLARSKMVGIALEDRFTTKVSAQQSVGMVLELVKSSVTMGISLIKTDVHNIIKVKLRPIKFTY